MNKRSITATEIPITRRTTAKRIPEQRTTYQPYQPPTENEKAKELAEKLGEKLEIGYEEYLRSLPVIDRKGKSIEEIESRPGGRSTSFLISGTTPTGYRARPFSVFIDENGNTKISIG